MKMIFVRVIALELARRRHFADLLSHVIDCCLVYCLVLRQILATHVFRVAIECLIVQIHQVDLQSEL